MSDSHLLCPLFESAAAHAIFSDLGRLQGMLDFEAALAGAEAACGVISVDAPAPIAAKCRAELFDIDKLAKAAAKAGNTAIPLIKELTALVAKDAPDAARFVHWGATSQDAMDTGLVLQLRAGLGLIERDLERLSGALAKLASDHKSTIEVGRTWMQHALPVTFGLRAAGWLDAVERHRARIADLCPRLLVVQFGGAAGTLASLGDRGLAVTKALAGELKLGVPDMPWHTQRDRVAELATTLGLIAGTLGKMARDLSLLMQTDIAEAFEPSGEGRGGSSTMPHKRNPVTSGIVLSAATRAPGLVATMLSAMVQEHERGLGGWHAEWTTLPELLVLVAGALAHTADTMTDLEIDAARMRANLDVTDGLIMAEAVSMALAAKVGKAKAHEQIEAASRKAVAEKRHLRQVLADDKTITAQLSVAELDRLMDPQNYLGMAGDFVDRVLAARRK